MTEHNTYAGGTTPITKKQNRIITRGLGPLLGGQPGEAGLITQGYTALYTISGAVDLAVQLVQRAYGGSRSGKEKKRLVEDDKIIVSARLIGINDSAIKSAIAGNTSTPIVRSLARLTVEHIKKQFRFVSSEYLVECWMKRMTPKRSIF